NAVSPLGCLPEVLAGMNAEELVGQLLALEDGIGEIAGAVELGNLQERPGGKISIQAEILDLAVALPVLFFPTNFLFILQVFFAGSAKAFQDIDQFRMIGGPDHPFLLRETGLDLTERISGFSGFFGDIAADPAKV